MKWIRTRWNIALLLIFLLLTVSETAWAGKYPYAEFKDTVSHETRLILIKYKLPVPHDRGNPWFSISGIPGHYKIWLYKTDEIPNQAIYAIIKLCMEFYEQRGRNDRFQIVMYYESKDEWRDSLFLGIAVLAGVKPYSELNIGLKE